MSALNSPQSYGWVAKMLHWLIALGIISMLILGFSLHLISRPHFLFWIQLHKSLGITILFLMIIRLIWRQFNQHPQLPPTMPHWQKLLAHLNHVALYLCAILLPLSGWAMTASAGYSVNLFGLVKLSTPWIKANPTASSLLFIIHHYGAWVILGLIALHGLAALKHYFINQDNILQRMLPRKRHKS